MDEDLRMLRNCWTPAEPTPSTTARARAALLDRAAGAGPADPPGARTRWRFPRRLVVVAGSAVLALFLVIGATFLPYRSDRHALHTGSGAGAGIFSRPVADAADALARAAAVAGGTPFTPPRPDQWTYVENTRTSSTNGPGGFTTGGPLGTTIEQSWYRADGLAVAQRTTGTDQSPLQVTTFETPEAISPPSGYDELSKLPTDPSTLLRWVDSALSQASSTPAHDAQSEFDTLDTILRTDLLQPALEAAIFEAIERIPGVALDRTVPSIDDRSAIGVGLVEDGWLSEELLFDGQSFAYLGERVITVASHTSTGLDGTFSVGPGVLQRLVVRDAAGIVSAPGQRP